MGSAQVLCRVSHEALRDLADRVRFPAPTKGLSRAY
jgi:hypothetical protein